MPGLFRRQQPVYLIDLHCYRPSSEYKVNKDIVDQIWDEYEFWDDETIQFNHRVFDKSGISRYESYLPRAVNPIFCLNKPQQDLDSAAIEAHMCLTGALQGLLEQTGMRPEDIDILVTTCSIYCPTPSMASMLVNHFKMRTNILSYHLGGMGCANGVVGVNLIKDLLQAHPNMNAVFVTTETLTPAYYTGKERNRLVTNLLFRMGAAAVLYSNKRSWGDKIKYKLQHNVRVHLGAVDDAYTAISWGPDAEGINGIYLGKNVVTEASRSLTMALTRVGRHLLTWRQTAEYVVNYVQRRYYGKSVSPYIPKFSEGADHFLIHAGGAKVLDGIGKALGLGGAELEPSRAVLHDYGNVSSSTTYYSLSYIETVKGVARGDKLVQIGVGSGIKCGVNIWQAQRDIREAHTAWEHRLKPEEAANLKRIARLRSPSTWEQLGLRLMLLLLMGVLLACVHVVTQHLAAGKRLEL